MPFFSPDEPVFDLSLADSRAAGIILKFFFKLLTKPSHCLLTNPTRNESKCTWQCFIYLFIYFRASVAKQNNSRSWEADGIRAPALAPLKEKKKKKRRTFWRWQRILMQRQRRDHSCKPQLCLRFTWLGEKFAWWLHLQVRPDGPVDVFLGRRKT